MYQRTTPNAIPTHLAAREAPSENRQTWDEQDVFDADVDKFGRQKKGFCAAMLGLCRAIGNTCASYLCCCKGRQFSPPKWIVVTVIAVVSLFLFMGVYDWSFDQGDLQRLYDRDMERMQAQAEYELQWFKNFQKQALEDMRVQQQKDVDAEQQWFHDEVAKVSQGHREEAQAHAETKAALEHAHGKHSTATQITDHLAQKVNQLYADKSADIEDLNAQMQTCDRERSYLEHLASNLEEGDHDVDKQHMEDYHTHSPYYHEDGEYDPYAYGEYEDHGEYEDYEHPAPTTAPASH